MARMGLMIEISLSSGQAWLDRVVVKEKLVIKCRLWFAKCPALYI